MGPILEALAEWVKGVIGAGGYFGIALLMALESACIPIPSELIMPFAGYLTIAAVAGTTPHTTLNFHLVSLAGAAGCALGSALAYWVGAKGGREFVIKYGKYILLKRKDVEMSEKWFEKWGASTVFIARLLPVVRTFISLPAGIARMPFAPFLILSFVGSVPWCYLLAYAGIAFANNEEQLKKYFHGADLVIGLVLLAGIGYWIWHHLKPDKPEAAGPSAG